MDAMISGIFARKNFNLMALLAMFAMAITALPQAALAQDEAVAASEEVAVAEGEEAVVASDASGFEHLGPDMILGQPEAGAYGFQDQYTEIGQDALWMHDALLMPIITVISIFVLFLLLWVVARFNRRANATASKTSHNTLIEVIWTVIPVLILVVIAVPSISLLSRQYETPPENAITIKANGYQWYWGYEYVDNGGFEVISNMMEEAEALEAGEPYQLAADNRMVVPAGVPIRLQTFGADVIHSFGVPSLWFKLDAVPGRINEKILTITEPGIYYGQCMELCGARHGYMPIAIEARTLEDYNAWVQTQAGGMTREQIEAEEAAAAAADIAAEEVSDEVTEEVADEAAEAVATDA